MSVLNEILNAGVASGAAPGFVAMTGNAAGVKWSGAAGERAPGRPMTEDTVFRIFSMTKAIGSTAAMILIDRGRLDLNAPVVSILSDFAKIQVLEGCEGDTPRLRAPKSRATIRQLATHTSGLVYEFWNPDVPRWMEKTGHPTILSGLKASLFYPMVFDPGTRWDYGIGIDWLCQAVEAIDGRRIDKFCQEEIFGPLGMTSSAFECEGALASRLASVSARSEDGKFAPFELAPPPHPEFYGMGHALYSTAGDYMRFLLMFLNKGVLNTHFWFDPAKDVAGTIMTQTLPFVEPRFLAVYGQFERAVYAAG